MSFSYVLGNIIGRMLVSYLLVWVVCFLVSRFNWRQAFGRSKRWYSVVAVLVLTLFGLGGAVLRAGGVS